LILIATGSEVALAVEARRAARLASLCRGSPGPRQALCTGSAQTAPPVLRIG